MKSTLLPAAVIAIAIVCLLLGSGGCAANGDKNTYIAYSYSAEAGRVTASTGMPFNDPMYYGGNIYFILVMGKEYKYPYESEPFGVKLMTFRKNHPELLIISTIPEVTHGYTSGCWLICEPKIPPPPSTQTP